MLRIKAGKPVREHVAIIFETRVTSYDRDSFAIVPPTAVEDIWKRYAQQPLIPNFPCTFVEPV